MSNYSSNALAENNENTAWMQTLSLIKDGWKVLDVGCSSGTFGEELIKKKKCIVDGIEIDAKDAALARKKLRRVEVLNVEDNMELGKIFTEKYDVITLIDVIEHLVTPGQTLKKLKTLLKPDGVVVFSIPNMAHASVRLSLLEGDFTYTQTGLLDKTHLHFYTGEEVQRVFSEGGYKIRTFNSSSLRYPDFFYEKNLEKLGLSIKNKQKFEKMLETTHGNVFQYVGLAAPTDSKNIIQPPVPNLNPNEKEYKTIKDTFDGQKEHIKFLEKSVKLKDDHINNLETIINNLQRRSLRHRLKKHLDKNK